MKTILQKITVLTLYMLFVTSYTFGAGTSLTVNSVTPSVACYGSAASISVIFTKGGSYTPGNQFIAQLSDASGGWGSPVNIGSITSTVANGFPIPSIIPLNTAPGTGYKIRVVSTTPVVVSGNSISFIINPLPAAFTGASSGICIGNNAVLGTTAVAGNTYSWVSSPAGFTSTSANPTVSPTETTTYTLTETIEATGCTKSNSVTITVNPLPAVTASATVSTLCAGASTTLSGSGASSYVWSGGVSNGVPFVPTSTTTYTVTGTDANSCSNTATITITVNPLPIVNLATFSNTCILTAVYPLSGGTPVGGIYSGTNVTGTNFNPGLAGVGIHLITYTYTDVNGCTSSDTSSIQVDATGCPPDTKVRALDCGITLVTLNQLIYCDGVKNAVDFEWEFVNTASGFSKTKNKGNGDHAMALFLISGIEYNKTYDVRVRAKVGTKWGNFNVMCQITTPASIPNTKVRTLDCGSVLSSLNQLIYCDAVPGAINYEWEFVNGSFSYSKTNTSQCAFNPTWIIGIEYNKTYDVRVRAKVGSLWGTFATVCQITTPQNIPDTKVRTLDCGSVLSSLNQLIYCDAVPGAINYEWEFVNGSFSYIKTNTSQCAFNPSWIIGIQYNKTYDVRVRAKVGSLWGNFSTVCQITTPAGKQMEITTAENNDSEIMKEGNNAIEITERKSETVSNDKEFNVYPNPNSGIINIITPYNMGTIEIFNQLGQLVYNQKIVNNATIIDLSKLNNGEYILKAKNTQGVQKLCELSLCDTDSGVQIKKIVIKK
ncbi:MAG: hypothetical protein A3F72_13870 [Bacteroidetes bacterium RIFCSPLOWO2_12_FULL_35_15]|nr:MAG: hypothetical protein A3F72_13870 [Bacteroidetes bacterium RIFCSPLOWO2_12_FULL_35_15]